MIPASDSARHFSPKFVSLIPLLVLLSVVVVSVASMRPLISGRTQSKVEDLYVPIVALVTTTIGIIIWRSFRVTRTRTHPTKGAESTASALTYGTTQPHHDFWKEPSANAETGPEVGKVMALTSRIAGMSDQQIRERYHDLVDKERSDLSALDHFELERIEARLDAEDRDQSLEAREREWQQDRAELLGSVEKLLAKLRNQSA